MLTDGPRAPSLAPPEGKIRVHADEARDEAGHRQRVADKQHGEGRLDDPHDGKQRNNPADEEERSSNDHESTRIVQR